MNHLPYSSSTTRRNFLKTVAVSGMAAAASPLSSIAAHHKSAGVKLGYDNFAVRAMNWMVEDHLKYSEKLGIDSLFMSDLDHFQRQMGHCGRTPKAVNQGCRGLGFSRHTRRPW